MTSSKNSLCMNCWRKWAGVIWMFLEMNLISANIFGFPALFKVLPKYGIYGSYCSSPNGTSSVEQDCKGQTEQYQVTITVLFTIDYFCRFIFQNALTLGLIFFNIPSIVVGILIDLLGARFVKLIGM